MVLSLVRKASTLAPLQCAKHATLPKVMPSALIFAKGSQQSSIESSNHLQGPEIETLKFTTWRTLDPQAEAMN